MKEIFNREMDKPLYDKNQKFVLSYDGKLESVTKQVRRLNELDYIEAFKVEDEFNKHFEKQLVKKL